MGKPVFVRDPYNYDSDTASEEAGIDFEGHPSLAQQNMRDETDINVLVQQFAAGMPLPESPPFDDVDVTGMQVSYQESLNFVIEARERFMTLPSAVRERFDNEPAKLLGFLENSANRDEAVRLGIVAAPPAPPEPPAPTPPAE